MIEQLLARPGATLAVIGLLTIAAAASAARVETDNTASAWLPASDPERDVYKDFRERFGGDTFVMVATFLIARGAGLNLFMRGPLLQAIITFGFGVVAGGSILALRAIFEPPAPFPLGSVTDTVLALLTGAGVTGALAPALFFIVQRIDGLVTRRREEVRAT